jgi:sulfur carrier protein
MTIVINGERQETEAGNILELVTMLGLTPKSLVVEHNQQIVRQENWEATALSDGDVLELLNFVGGG